MSVPSSELGLPTPCPVSECAPPRNRGGGGVQTHLRVRGWGSPNSNDWRKGLVLCLVSTLCIQSLISNFPPAELQSQLDTTKGAEKGGGERDKYKNLARRLKEERNNYKELAEEKRKEQEELKVI